jgi:hypothetical protein
MHSHLNIGRYSAFAIQWPQQFVDLPVTVGTVADTGWLTSAGACGADGVALAETRGGWSGKGVTGSRTVLIADARGEFPLHARIYPIPQTLLGRRSPLSRFTRWAL